MTKDPSERLSRDGTIWTGVEVQTIRDPYRQAVDAVVQAFGEIDSSVYVYGSVATGQARTPESGIDMLVVSRDPKATALAARLSTNLSRRFRHIAREVAVGAVDPDEIFADTRDGLAWKAFIKHYCACVSGEDLGAAFKPAVVSRDLATGLAGQFLANTRKCLAEASDADDREVTTKKIVEAARRTLLGIAPLVSVRQGTWTTDREDAVQLASELNPELIAQFQRIWRAVNTGAVGSAHEVEQAIDTILMWAQEELFDHQQNSD